MASSSALRSSALRMSRRIFTTPPQPANRGIESLRFSSTVATPTPPTNPAVTSTKTDKKDSSKYISPFQDLFDEIEAEQNGQIVRPPEPTPRFLECGVPEDALRYITTHYGRLVLAPHVEAWEQRVVLQIDLKHMPIRTDTEKAMLKQIVGNRYDTEKERMQLSCNLFGSRIENKRHLETMLNRIVLGAKELAKQVQEQEEQVNGVDGGNEDEQQRSA